VLLLVPEIALTPSLEARWRAGIPPPGAVLHSGATDAARGRAFALAQAGVADVVIGTRLAVFTPLPRLGLILVDEEHDAAYKQQDGVRYSARDVAIWRARQRGVPILLGSATPSLESWQHARSGRYRLLALPERARPNAVLPALRCVDTRKLPLREGLSVDLLGAIEARLQRGEQSLVFLNRRGFAPVLACPACGWVSDCPHCAAHMVLHAADGRMRCHHCGLDTACRAPARCAATRTSRLRARHQRIEAALSERFPEARILRVDRDAVRSPRQWHEVLAAATSGEADILVGTQMLSKGHDFPRVTLWGWWRRRVAIRRRLPRPGAPVRPAHAGGRARRPRRMARRGADADRASAAHRCTARSPPTTTPASPHSSWRSAASWAFHPSPTRCC